MSYRDDHDAALERAAALEAEVEQVAEERDALAAKVKALEAQQARKPEPAPKPKPKPDQTSRDRRRAQQRLLFVAMLVTMAIGGVLVFVLLSGTSPREKRKQERAALAASRVERLAKLEHWHALINFESCVHYAAYNAQVGEAKAPDDAHPRRLYQSGFMDELVTECTKPAEHLAGLSAPAARAALTAWLAAVKDLSAPVAAMATYYRHADYKDDDFALAPKLWAPVHAGLAKMRAALAAVRRDAQPAVRAELLALQQAHEAKSGRDNAWWRIELSRHIWAINDESYEAAGIYEGRRDEEAGAKGIRIQLSELGELIKQAPLDIRRLLRSYDELIKSGAAGQPLPDRTLVWTIASADDLLIDKDGDKYQL